ncbi:uncharacterized protein LACBIDRAFT_336192, partial [Laccaria bicolor S238N-H82]
INLNRVLTGYKFIDTNLEDCLHHSPFARTLNEQCPPRTFYCRIATNLMIVHFCSKVMKESTDRRWKFGSHNALDIGHCINVTEVEIPKTMPSTVLLIAAMDGF